MLRRGGREGLERRRTTLAVAIAAALALLIGVPAGATADDRYAAPVAHPMADPAVCALSAPCDLPTAVEDLSVDDGDRVLLLAGPFNLGADQLFIDENITIEPRAGLPRQTLASVYSMPGGAILADPMSAQNAVIRDILLSHGGGPSTTALALFEGTAERVYVVSNGFIACGVWSGTLRDSVCFLTAAAAPTAIGAVGASQGGGLPQQSTLRNVTAISKEPNAPGVVLSAVANAELAMDARNVIAESTTFDVLASAAAGSTASISLANSNFPVFDAAGAGGSVTPNTVAGNQATPPLFTNFAANVFSQAPGSPTIDAGAVDPFIGSLDVDGNPRVLLGKAVCPNTALPDIGAYEAPAVTPAVCPVATLPAPPATPAPKCKKPKKKKRGKVAAKKKKKNPCKKRKRKKRR